MIVNVIIVLIIVGVLLYLVNNYIPMDDKIKKLVNWVTITSLVVWILKVFNVIGWINGLFN
jgi:hypothetical protein